MTAGKEESPKPSDAVDPETGMIREGLAEVLPNSRPSKTDGKAEVFYNPAQVFNRDLSILVISVFAKLRQADIDERQRKKEQRAKEAGKPCKDAPPRGLKVLEALAATGIRSIRYAKELEAIRCIVANDLDETAVGHIRRNMAHNGVPPERIEVTCSDASLHMYNRRCRGAGGCGDTAYDVIDLDPYGTVSPFLDAAVQAVGDGGLLCITSTDMPILGGNNPETCFARYGGAAIKSSYVHEMALRLVMHATSTAAAKYGREARPLVCISIDFYVRLFVRIFDSAARAKYQASKTGIVHQCVQCESFFVQPLGDASGEGNSKFKPPRVVTPGSECPECSNRIKLGGPFYIGSLYDQDFVNSCLEVCNSDEASLLLPGVTSWKKVRGLLTAISEEHGDLVLHYRLPQLCKGLKLEPVPLKQFRGTLAALGYRVSHFHREPEAIKTDAPNHVVYDLMRLWAKERPPKNTPLPGLLSKEISLKRDLQWVTEEEVARSSKVPRFLPNPEANWGPKARARGGGGDPAADGPSAPSSIAADATATKELGDSSAATPLTASSAAEPL
jgi:tRNA (guanine26-N2/guanine27-N2)-dimethyltransferase